MIRNMVVSFILNSPKKSILFSLIFFILSVPGLLFISSDFSYRTWYGESDPLLKNYDQYEREFGNDDNIIISIFHNKGIFNKKTLTLINDLTKEIDSFDETSFVDSLSTFVYMEGNKETVFLKELFKSENLDLLKKEDLNKIEKRAQTQFFSKGRLIDSKSKMTIIEAAMVPTEGKNIDYGPFVLKMRSILQKFEKKYPNHRFQILGNAQIAFLFKEIVEKDVSLLFPFLFIIFTIVLKIVLKRMRLIIFTYFNIAISIASMMGVMGYLGFKITSITSIAPQMLFTIALADIIHLLISYKLFNKKKSLDNSFRNALEYSLKKNFYPTLLTTLTTSVGLLSFTFSKVGTVSELGVIIAVGVVFAWCYSYFLFSPILLFSEKKWGERLSKDVIQKKSLNFFKLVKSYHKYFLGGSFIVFCFSLYFCSKLIIDMNPIHQFKEGHFFRKAHSHFKNHFNYSSSLEVVLFQKGNKSVLDPLFMINVDKFNDWVLKQEEVQKTLSLLDIVKILNSNFNGGKKEFYKIPESRKEISSLLLFYQMGLPSEHNSNRFINFDQKILKISFLTTLESSKKGLEFISRVNNKLKKLGIKGHVTGKIPLFHELTPYVFNTFWKSFIFALLIISLILMVVLKSFSLGLLSLIPNLFPLLIGGAIYYILGIPLDMGSALIASFCLGISVDDTIHFLFDYKRNKNNKMELKENLERIVDYTYPALFFTSLVLAIGFASFSTASYIPNIKFGIMVALILILALFFDFFVLPSLLMVKKKKNAN